MSQTKTDIPVSNTWIDVVAAFNSLPGDPLPENYFIAAKCNDLILQYGAEPDADSIDGEPIHPEEKISVVNEPTAWVRTRYEGSVSRIHVGIEA